MFPLLNHQAKKVFESFWVEVVSVWVGLLNLLIMLGSGLGFTT